MEYKAELDEAMLYNETYEENMFKLYDLLWDKCDKEMKNNIASRSEYNTLVYNNPIELL